MSTTNALEFANLALLKQQPKEWLVSMLDNWKAEQMEPKALRARIDKINDRVPEPARRNMAIEAVETEFTQAYRALIN
jgi:hypothetical protein